MGNEYHCHYFLLRDVIQVALVCYVEDTVRVGDHALPLFLW